MSLGNYNSPGSTGNGAGVDQTGPEFLDLVVVKKGQGVDNSAEVTGN